MSILFSLPYTISQGDEAGAKAAIFLTEFSAVVVAYCGSSHMVRVTRVMRSHKRNAGGPREGEWKQVKQVGMYAGHFTALRVARARRRHAEERQVAFDDVAVYCRPAIDLGEIDTRTPEGRERARRLGVV